MVKLAVLRLLVLLQVLLVVNFLACSITGPDDSVSLVADLAAKIPEIVARGNSPSIQTAVVYDGQVAWSGAFGENTSVDHVYMCASVQKVFTAAAVLQLVERGLVDLDADVDKYLPFPVRHPDFPEKPVTARMLLAHRSGLNEFPNQFGWDTESAFSPRFRPAPPDHLLSMSLEEFLRESLTPGGMNYDRDAWVFEPGTEFRYSVSAYALSRYLIGRVSGLGYEAFMRENIFDPLGMTGSGFDVDEFPDRHAIPYTRIDEENFELPLWSGRGSLMHTTAGDMAKFMVAMLNSGRLGDLRILQAESIDLMQRKTTGFKTFLKGGDDLPTSGRGLGLVVLRGGWYGIGGSVPGFQCLWRYHPSRRVGYVILSNVNAILAGGENYGSARSEIYRVQDALVSILDPMFLIRSRAAEIGFFGSILLVWGFALGSWIRGRRVQKRSREA